DGTLHLRVAPVAALELQHEAPRLIERINGYFGYAAVAELRLVQAPLKKRNLIPPRRAKKRVDPARQSELAHRLEAVEDPEMRQTLNRLGMAILSESGESTEK
ncbi:MAG: DciA family protein, partial [Pseudomonadota bacterium]|nr:DciA family protein [Pseudomonadota bacterium]